MQPTKSSVNFYATFLRLKQNLTLAGLPDKSDIKNIAKIYTEFTQDSKLLVCFI